MERRAEMRYRLRGYRILGRNVWVAGNELDLIARRGRQIVFCEVKAKARPELGDPLEMVDQEKRRRVGRAAESWLAARPQLRNLDVRFDVVVDRGGRLTCLQDAF